MSLAVEGLESPLGCEIRYARKGLESSSAKQEQPPERFRQLAPRMAANLPFEF